MAAFGKWFSTGHNSMSGTMIDENQNETHVRALADSASVTFWAPGDLPTTWKDQQPWVRLWDAQTKREGDIRGTLWHGDRLIVGFDREIGASLTTSGFFDYVDQHNYTSSLRYIANQNDHMHQESQNIDEAVLRLNVVNLDVRVEIMRFVVKWTGASLSAPIEETYEVFAGADNRSGDSTIISTMDLDVPAAVLASLKTLANGESITIEILKDHTTSGTLGLIEFGMHSEDIAPRIIGYKVTGETVTRPDVLNMSDYTVSAKASPLSNTLVAKLDDSHSFIGNGLYPASSSSLFGRYNQMNRTIDASLFPTVETSAILGNPFASSTPFIASSKTTYTAFGTVSNVQTVFGNDIQAQVSANGFQKLTYPNSAVSTTNDTIGRPGIELGALEGLSPHEYTDIIFGGQQHYDQYFGLCRIKRTVSENGIVSKAYINALGRVVKTIDDSAGLQVKSQYRYDHRGRLVQYLNPKNQPTSMVYDSYGRVTQLTHPDYGITRSKYDRLGRVRFTQSQVQAIPDAQGSTRITWFSYDDLGRITLTGETSLANGVSIDQLNPYAVNINYNPMFQLAPIVNSTVWSGNTTFAEWRTRAANCIPQWGWRFPSYEPPATAPLDAFARPATVSRNPATPEFGIPGAIANRVEDLALTSVLAKQSNLYDEIPPAMSGAIWGGLQFRLSSLQCVMPKGTIRNTKGRMVASAYRDDGRDKFWYKVFSYDERGRIEAIVRLNENTGIDAIYYTYNSAGNVSSIRVADPIRNYATWYSYDDAGRASGMWTAISPIGDQYGFGAAVDSYSIPNVRCYSDITFVQRPEIPDATWQYNVAGQVSSTTYYNVDGFNSNLVTDVQSHDWSGRVTSEWTRLINNTILTKSQLSVTSQDQGGAITARTSTVLADVRQEVLQYNGIGSLNYVEQPSVDIRLFTIDLTSARTQSTLSTMPIVFDLYTTGATNAIAGASLQTEFDQPTLQYQSDAKGRMTQRITQLPTFPPKSSTESFLWGFHDRLLQLQVSGDRLYPVIGCEAVLPSENSNWSEIETWSYRYSPSGEREQKRLMFGPVHDKQSCGTAPWTYYLLGQSESPLVVYTGRQIFDASNPCQSYPGSRFVVMYASEYRAYGPGGVAVIWERDVNGELVKRFIKLDEQGSVNIATGANGYEQGSNYTPFGTATNPQFVRRTAWLDKEVDYETSPLLARNRLIDVSARKYEPMTGRFITPDQLWFIRPQDDPFVYGAHDPINNVDPSGLALYGSGGGHSSTQFAGGTRRTPGTFIERLANPLQYGGFFFLEGTDVTEPIDEFGVNGEGVAGVGGVIGVPGSGDGARNLVGVPRNSTDATRVARNVNLPAPQNSQGVNYSGVAMDPLAFLIPYLPFIEGAGAGLETVAEIGAETGWQFDARTLTMARYVGPLGRSVSRVALGVQVIFVYRDMREVQNGEQTGKEFALNNIGPATGTIASYAASAALGLTAAGSMSVGLGVSAMVGGTAYGIDWWINQAAEGFGKLEQGLRGLRP